MPCKLSIHREAAEAAAVGVRPRQHDALILPGAEPRAEKRKVNLRPSALSLPRAVQSIVAAAVAAICVYASSDRFRVTAGFAQTSPPPVWTVPEIGAPPDDANGRLVRRGRDLVSATYAHVGPEVADPALRFAGNNLACGNCHLNAGTK